MFSYGFCYGNNDGSVRGYKQSGLVKTGAAAEKALKDVLANQGKTNITFKATGDGTGFRAYADHPGTTLVGAPENYIYFKLPETWMLVDARSSAKKVAVDKGSLDELKIAARKLVGAAAVKFLRDGGSYRVKDYAVYIVKVA